jgi:hypothetical protein
MRGMGVTTKASPSIVNEQSNIDLGNDNNSEEILSDTNASELESAGGYQPLLRNGWYVDNAVVVQERWSCGARPKRNPKHARGTQTVAKQRNGPNGS